MSVLCTPSDVPEGGFINSIPMVMRGNCTFYEKVRLAQINGARGLLIVSREKLVSVGWRVDPENMPPRSPENPLRPCSPSCLLSFPT